MEDILDVKDGTKVLCFHSNSKEMSLSWSKLEFCCGPIFLGESWSLSGSLCNRVSVQKAVTVRTL